jgi:hypothetical protein
MKKVHMTRHCVIELFATYGKEKRNTLACALYFSLGMYPNLNIHKGYGSSWEYQRSRGTQALEQTGGAWPPGNPTSFLYTLGCFCRICKESKIVLIPLFMYENIRGGKDHI